MTRRTCADVALPGSREASRSPPHTMVEEKIVGDVLRRPRPAPYSFVALSGGIRQVVRDSPTPEQSTGSIVRSLNLWSRGDRTAPAPLMFYHLVREKRTMTTTKRQRPSIEAPAADRQHEPVSPVAHEIESAPARHVPTREDIEVRAYFLWNETGSPTSDPVTTWLKAERELWERYEGAGATSEAGFPGVSPAGTS